MLFKTINMSVEDQLSAIESQYNKAYHLLYEYRNYTSVSPSTAADMVKNVLLFQRMIELLCEDIIKLTDQKTKKYIDRCIDNLKAIHQLIRGSQTSSGVCGYLDTDDFKKAFYFFQFVRSIMYQILEDVRLIYALKLYPIEEKMALKSLLTDYGFLEVTKCLDEAETNLAEKHYKDCIDRAREALEKTITSILISKKKKPSGSFATDIGTLSNMGIIDKETKKLTEATYSYLSEVGAHGRAGEVTISDAHYALKEVYMRIDIALKKYKAYLSKSSK
jgi:uncharacterized protein (UPF0332 family)